MQVTANCSPCSTVFRKASQCKRHANSDANQLRLLGRRWWLGNHRVKQGRPDIHSAASPDCRACRAGVGRVQAPSSQLGRVAQRKLSSPATDEKTRQLSISWRMCVHACVCVPRALTGLADCQAMPLLGNSQKARPDRGHTLCRQQPQRRTRNTNLILPPTKTNSWAPVLCTWLQ